MRDAAHWVNALRKTGRPVFLAAPAEELARVFEAVLSSRPEQPRPT
ncbi:hypothetical protein [Streptomyces sp. NPDC059063]